jgi:CHASE2 domain-containing sensor protein
MADPRRWLSLEWARNLARQRRFWPALRAGLGAFLLILFVRLTDPLGLDQALFQQTGNIVSRLLTLTYPKVLPAERVLPGGKARFARDQIVVITLDQEYLEHQPYPLPPLRWPLPPRRVAELLRQVLEAKPRLVFLDLVLSGDDAMDPAMRPDMGSAADQVSGVERLEAVLRRARRMDPPVPVILADLPLTDETVETDCPAERSVPPPARAGEDKPVVPAPAATASVKVERVLIRLACLAGGLAPVVWNAPDQTYPAAARDKRPTPAFLMYDRLFAAARDAHPAAAHERLPLLMVWSAGPEAGETCPYKGVPLGFWDGARLLWYTLFPNAREAAGAPDACLPSVWRSGAILFNITARKARQELLAGKVVLIGPAWDTSPDTVTTTILGRVPGVFLHAMALDNLMSYGPAYPRAETEGDDVFRLEPWLSALIIGLGIGGARVARTLWPGRIGPWREYGLSVGLVSVAAVAASFSPHVATSFWVALPITVGVIDPLMKLGGGHMPGHDEGRERHGRRGAA